MARVLARYRLDLVAVQEVRFDEGAEGAGENTFSMDIQFWWGNVS